jgi:hypothetical protein
MIPRSGNAIRQDRGNIDRLAEISVDILPESLKFL